MTLGIVLALAGLGGCVDHGYNYRLGAVWFSQPYHVWYDGHYGAFHDGYWGTDGFFYFRITDRDRQYRRGHEGHFRRERVTTDSRFRYYEGTSKKPSRETRMPNYPAHRDHDERR